MFRGPAHVSKLRTRRRNRRLVLALIVGFCGIISVAGLAGLSYLPQISIQHIEIQGISTIPEEDVRGSIERVLDETYAFIFPKRNIFLYPKRELERQLLSSYPKLLSADLSLKEFNSILLQAEERSPLALWCGKSRGEKEPCYFLDKDGFIYAPAPEFSGTVFVRYFGSAPEEPLGAQFGTGDSFRSLSALVSELGSRGEPSDVEVTEEGDAQVYFLEGFSLLLALEDKPESILERLALVLESDPLKGTDLGTLAYIDLRFGDRVVYKFK